MTQAAPKLPASLASCTGNPFPSRRAALLGALGIASAAALPPAAVAAAHPDAELIAACARLRASWRHLGELLAVAGDDDDAWDAASDLTQPERQAAMDIIMAARASTMDGIFARVAALAETAEHFFQERWIEGDDDEQRYALLRDLAAIGAV